MEQKVKAIALAYTPAITRAAVICAALAALALFLYGFFLLEAVAHTAGRTQAQRQIESYNSKLSVLESRYLTATRDITLERAHELGYVSPKAVATTYAGNPARSLSLRTQ